MHLVTVCFDYPDRPEFGILLDTFRASVKFHMPNVKLIELRPTPPEREKHRVAGFLDNTFKLDQWVKHLDETDDNVIFIDCDMIALRSAEHAFDYEFDIAYTACPHGYKVQLNGGVLMARSTMKAREFLHNMKKVNDFMFDHPEFHEKWRAKYAGMNQSAFGCVIETMKNGTAIHKYMTREWNAIDCDINKMAGDTVFLHIRQKLRKMVLNNEKPVGPYRNAMIAFYRERDRIQQDIKAGK